MQIQLSETTFRRLQSLATPLVDSVEDVIVRLIDAFEQKGKTDMVPRRNQNISRSIGRPRLSGFLKELWDLIGSLPTERFSLRDMYARMGELERKRPDVKEMGASVRAGLQKLRDKNFIEFLDNQGNYRRLC